MACIFDPFLFSFIFVGCRYYIFLGRALSFLRECTFFDSFLIYFLSFLYLPLLFSLFYWWFFYASAIETNRLGFKEFYYKIRGRGGLYKGRGRGIVNCGRSK